MGLLDTNYQDQRLTASQKKKIKPAIQGGGYNYLGEQEEVTVPKKWLSDPDHVVAELAYITPREKKVLIDLNMYGSLDGKPNNAPGGLPSLQGDMGSIGGGSSGGGSSGGGSSGGGSSGGGNGGGSSTKPSAPPGGGATSLGSGRDYSPPSTPSQPSGNGGNGGVDPGFQEALRQQAIQQQNPVYGDPDPQIDVDPRERDSITSFLDNYAANVKANPLMAGTIGALTTLYQTEQAKNMLLDTPGYEFLNDYSISDNGSIGGDGGSDRLATQLISQLPLSMTGSTPQQSMVNQYFANLGMSQGSPLSSKLQTDYNNAKNNINSILGVNQQFGYSTDPYGGLMASNLADNPFNIEYMKTRGLI